MAKEKIKVSFIIDKDEAKNAAFKICKTPSEFKEIENIISGADEVERDVTTEEDGHKKEVAIKYYSCLAVDNILRSHKDLAVSKRINAGDEEPDNNDSDDNGAKVEVIKLNGDKVKEIIKSIFGKEE